MSLILSSCFLVTGAFFMLVAAIGILRLPDLLIRMHSSTKAGTLGIGLIFMAVAIYFGHLDTTMMALAALVFVALTAPIGSHIIARGALMTGIKLWKGTIVDEMRKGKIGRS